MTKSIHKKPMANITLSSERGRTFFSPGAKQSKGGLSHLHCLAFYWRSQPEQFGKEKKKKTTTKLSPKFPRKSKLSSVAGNMVLYIERVPKGYGTNLLELLCETAKLQRMRLTHKCHCFYTRLRNIAEGISMVFCLKWQPK